VNVEQKLMDLGLKLPTPATPLGKYVPATRAGDLVFTAGQLPLVEGKLMTNGGEGKATEDRKEEVKQAAKIAALNALAAIKQCAGSLNEVEQIVKVGVYVASEPDFYSQPYVANGASELIGEVFGEQGFHARSAIGVPCLPINASVEVELVAKLKS